MKPKIFRDPNYVTLQRLLMKKERKSRKNDFLKIKNSDPGKLLQLIKDLHDSEGTKVQLKVNKYLQDVTLATMSFIIEECNRVPEAVVRVIGKRELTSKILFQVDNKFIQRLRKTEHPIDFKECFIDPVLLETVKQILVLSYSTSYRNFLAIPIYHPYRKKVIFYLVLVNYNSDIPQSHYCALVGECFRYCHEIVLNTLRCDEEKYFHAKYKAILYQNINSITFLDYLPALISYIRSSVLDIFAAERCRIYLIEGKVLRTKITEFGQAFDTSDELINDIRVPVGVGLVGWVAETGKIHNCTNPNIEPMYEKTLENPTRKRSRNTLTFPILLYTGVYGVIQVHDKIEACHFDAADVEFARYLGPLYGIQIHISLSMKKLWDAINRRTMTEELFLKGSQVSGDEVNLIMNCTRKHEYTDFFSYKFLPGGLDPQDVICICLKAFEEYELLRIYSIDRRNFIRFLTQIRNRHLNFPLHNWQHSFCSFHFLYILSKNEELLKKELVNHLEMLAMLVATLGHAMEFTGSTSPYQPTAGTTLASLYSTPGSLLQYYSLSQLVRLMTSKDFNITDSLEPEEFRGLIKNLDRMFLFMDLAYHVSNRQNLAAVANNYDSRNQEHLTALLSVVLISSELSDYCKPYEYCNVFSDNTLDEFYSPDTKDCSGVIDITGFTDNIKMKKVELQIHFMRDICLEAFTLLTKFLPGTISCLNAAEENSEKFKLKKDAVIQEQMEQL